MASKNHKNANVAPPITPEELGRKYTLGVSEIIAKKVIDHIIQVTINMISLNHVETLERAYTMRKTYEILNRCVNMNIIKPQEETDLPLEDLIINIPTPCIDTWASNKTKITQIAKQQAVKEEVERKDSVVNNKFKSLTTNKKKEKIKKSNTLTSQTGKSTGKPKMSSPEGFKAGLKKPVKEANPINLHPQYNIEDMEKEEEEDELETLRDRALRTYFKEREIEKQRKIKLEQEAEEHLKEEEKKKKKGGGEDFYKKPFYYNTDGKIEYIKPPDLENVTVYQNPSFAVKEGDIKVIGELEPFIRKETEDLFEQDTEKQDKSKIFRPDPTVFERKFSTFYQPNPLESHKMEKGVTMTYYEDIIKGGGFPEIQGRMTYKEFTDIVNKMKPKQKGLDALRVFDGEMEGMIKKGSSLGLGAMEDLESAMGGGEMTNLNNMSKYSNKYLINLLLEDEMGGSRDRKLRKEFKSLEFLSPKKKLKLLKKVMEEKKKRERERSKTEKQAVIKASKDFQYDLVEKYNDELLYDHMNEEKERIKKDENELASKTTQRFHNPLHQHVEYEKELGHYNKYPRERLSKKVLQNTGRMAIEIKEEKIKWNFKKTHNNESQIPNNTLMGSIEKSKIQAEDPANVTANTGKKKHANPLQTHSAITSGPPVTTKRDKQHILDKEKVTKMQPGNDPKQKPATMSVIQSEKAVKAK